jgi:carbamate kinase
MTRPVLPWEEAGNRPLVVAFGGNALLPDPDDPTGAERRADEFAAALLLLLPDHAGLVLVHGNGPQVGALQLRVEATRDQIPPEPLDVLVAETQGSIGYLLTRSLRNVLASRGREVEVATVVTQVIVDPDDPAMTNPTKPVGPFYEPDKGRALADQYEWDMVDIPNRGLRRVVPSPQPREVVEIHTVADAARHGHLVVAGGGGGVPVTRGKDGELHGVEGVIDKDRTAALLAKSLRSGGFVILTEVGHASTSFGTPDQQSIPEMNADRAEELLAAGEFPPGSMGPKVEASADYARRMGRPALITSVPALPDALEGEDGTWITP